MGGGGGVDQIFSWTGDEPAVKCYSSTDNQNMMEGRQQVQDITTLLNFICSVNILWIKFQDYKLFFVGSPCYKAIYNFFSVTETLFWQSLNINGM